MKTCFPHGPNINIWEYSCIKVVPGIYSGTVQVGYNCTGPVVRNGTWHMHWVRCDIQSWTWILWVGHCSWALGISRLSSWVIPCYLYWMWVGLWNSRKVQISNWWGWAAHSDVLAAMVWCGSLSNRVNVNMCVGVFDRWREAVYADCAGHPGGNASRSGEDRSHDRWGDDGEVSLVLNDCTKYHFMAWRSFCK